MRFSRTTCRLAAALMVLLIGAVGVCRAEDQAFEPLGSQELKKAAYDSLWRLKRAMERDGYYSSRVALNVWRSNAIDAGVFDAAEYEAYKRQIYEKSIQYSFRCFQYAVENGKRLDARICLHTWKMHSEIMDTFDPEVYENLQKKLSALSEETAK
jgi:hypothetical protein